MKDDLEQNLLFRYLGTISPYWRLTADSNVLHFATSETSDTCQTIDLDEELATRIREMTAITSSVTMTLTISGVAQEQADSGDDGSHCEYGVRRRPFLGAGRVESIGL